MTDLRSHFTYLVSCPMLSLEEDWWMRRVARIALLAVCTFAFLCLATMESLRNDSGTTASGVTIRFSESVRITSWDTATFSTCSPASQRAASSTFSGGTLAAGSRFRVSWSPSDATVTAVEWLTAAVASPETPMGLETASDTPTVTGDLLNAAYFAHAAYVMQGVSDRDKIFAMPLLGISELAFSPTVSGIDPATVTWSLQISHLGRIGAEVSSGTIYIWGSDASWVGHGGVVLTGTAADGRSGSVTIPVTVFQTDRTLSSAEGSEDYFVPWSTSLDIGRILSVEEHMRRYNKTDTGLLDRTLRFSRWRPMEYRKDVDFLTVWCNESVPWAQGWTEATQFALVDVFLRELLPLGVNGIRFRDVYYFQGLTGTELSPIYDRAHFGVTRQPHETAYIVNEAHRLGLSVILGNAYFPHVPGRPYELYDANPTPVNQFFDNVTQRELPSLREWTRLGVDIVDLGTQLETINGGPHTWDEATYRDDRIAQLARDARSVYPGPLYHAALGFGLFYPGGSQLEGAFWEEYDILGSGVMALQLTHYRDPTVEQMLDGWRDLIREIHQPFQSRYNKPLLAYENGCLAVKACANWGGYGGDCKIADLASQPLSLETVRRWYLSQDAAFNEMEGYFGPGWHFYAFDPSAVGSVRDKSANPRLKMESVIQTLFVGTASSPLRSIDGSVADWSDSDTVGLDPSGDSVGASDLTRVGFTQDGAYLYFRVDYVAPPSGDLRIDMDVDGDLKEDLHLDLSDRYTPDGTWWGNSYIYSPGQLRMGIVDSIDAGSSIEMRVPRRFLEGIVGEEYLSVRLVHYDRFWNLGDDSQWFTVWGRPRVTTPSVFEVLDCGTLTADPLVALDGARSMMGAYDGTHSFMPYLRTVPSKLPLRPLARYRVCFDYRILETSTDGFELLFFSPAGAKKNAWITPLRVYGQDGTSGHACLEGQLLDYSDFEIRWNVVSTGRVVVDNISVVELSTGEEIAREDFEAWR